MILPFIEESKLYKEYRFDEPWDGPNNRKLADRMPRLYAIREARRPQNAVTNYLVVVGDETAWPATGKVTLPDVSDGPDQTILIVENRGAEVHWMEPRDLLFAEMDFRVNSPSGVSSPYDAPAVATIDGSLHKLSPKLTPNTLRALLTIRGGERLGRDAAGGWEALTDGRDRPLREPHE